MPETGNFPQIENRFLRREDRRPHSAGSRLITHTSGGAPRRVFILCRYKLGTDTVRHQICEKIAADTNPGTAAKGFSKHTAWIFAGYLRSLSLQCRRPGAFGVVAGKQRPRSFQP